MHKIIMEQLKKISFANLNNFDEKTNTYFIPKYSKPKYELNKCYLIKVNSELINNPRSAAATNWNNGKYPQNQYYKVYISKTLGNMLYLDCLAYDNNTKTDLTDMWSGWLSVDDITQLAII